MTDSDCSTFFAFRRTKSHKHAGYIVEYLLCCSGRKRHQSGLQAPQCCIFADAHLARPRDR